MSLRISSQSDRQLETLHFYLLASLFAALTAAGAFIKIPLPYVPITLQLFFVILAGSLLGPKFGALSQLVYLAVGLIGVPVFANGGGPAYIFQPTFGYLLGFPLGAYVVGRLVHMQRCDPSRGPSFFRLCVAGFIGVLIILVLGASVLYFNLKLVVQKPISMNVLVVSYFLFFLPGDIIKVLLSAFTSSKLYRVVYRAP